MVTQTSNNKRPSAPKFASLALLKQAVLRRVEQRIAATGTIRIPAVPALLESYVDICASVFSAVGRALTTPERVQVAQVLGDKLQEAFTQSPRSKIVVRFESDAGCRLGYEVQAEVSTIADAYERWIGTTEQPLFGAHADARICSLVHELGVPADSPLLDLGAGTGRNALSLARQGYPVDAVEITPKFAEMISASATREALPITVVARDVMRCSEGLRDDFRMLLASEVVPDFRGPEDLRRLFVLANRVLADGGLLVFNVHLAAPGYTPDRAAREFAQQCYSAIFTSNEIAAAAVDLPFEFVSNDSVHDYEREHLPKEAWPPTPWFVNWSLGLDVFETDRARCPIELRWLVFRKREVSNGPATGNIRAALDTSAEIRHRSRRFDSAQVRNALLQRLKHRWVAAGSYVFPAIPGCCDHYADTCLGLFDALGRSSVQVHRTQLTENFQRVLDQAYAQSPRSNVVVTYEVRMGAELHYSVTSQAFPLASAYEEWMTRLPAPLFGANPDARLVSLITQLDARAKPEVLDLGAGTGRNALYLAKLGFSVRAVELTPQLAILMRSEAQRCHVPLQVDTADLFEDLVSDQRKYALIVLGGVAGDFRSSVQLRRFFELAASRLDSGGQLLLSVHVAVDGYQADATAVQLAQQSCAMFFTREELRECTDGLDIELVSDESAFDFEYAQLPTDAWPPTPVFEEWATCQHIFDLPRERCPVELRWLVYRRAS